MRARAGDTAAGLCLNSKLRAATEFTQFSLDQCGESHWVWCVCACVRVCARACHITSITTTTTTSHHHHNHHPGRGYFPDGGATHWLPKLDGGLGMYLALTGETLYGRDVVYARLANYYLPKQQWHSFMDCLQETIGKINFAAYY